MNRLKTEIVNLFESDEMKACISSEYDSLHILTKADIVKGAITDICNILWENICAADKAGKGVSESELDEISERSIKEWYSREYSG